jgi:hypothetical protein
MKQLEINNENVKNAVINIISDILKLNEENTTIYIRINENDDLVLDDVITVETGYSINLEEDKKYIKVNLTNIREYDDDEIFHIERIIEYIDEYGYGYHKSPEYQEEKKKIEKIIIEDEILPYVIDEINKAIDDYIRNKEFEVS